MASLYDDPHDDRAEEERFCQSQESEEETTLLASCPDDLDCLSVDSADAYCDYMAYQTTDMTAAVEERMGNLQRWIDEAKARQPKPRTRRAIWRRASGRVQP